MRKESGIYKYCLIEEATIPLHMTFPSAVYPLTVLVFGWDMSLDGTVWNSPRPWTRRCNVFGHLGHIYNIYIYSKFNLKIKN